MYRSLWVFHTLHYTRFLRCGLQSLFRLDRLSDDQKAWTRCGLQGSQALHLLLGPGSFHGSRLRPLRALSSIGRHADPTLPPGTRLPEFTCSAHPLFREGRDAGTCRPTTCRASPASTAAGLRQGLTQRAIKGLGYRKFYRKTACFGSFRAIWVWVKNRYPK